MRKNEISRLTITVTGRHLNHKNEEKRHYYKIESHSLSQVLNRLQKKPPSFKSSFVDIQNSDSAKFQKIGLENYTKKQLNGVTFYHFQGGYVYREKEDLQKIELKKKEIDRIKLGDTEFQYSRFHFTIIPSYNVVVVDSKAHSKPTSIFINELIKPHLNSSDYRLNPDEIDSRVRTKIYYIPKSDFDKVVNSNLETLRSVGIELAKPSSMKKEAYSKEEIEEEMEFYKEGFAQALGTFFGIDIEKMKLNEVPFKKMKIQFVLETDSQSKILPKLKKGLKTFLHNNKEDAYLKNTELHYKNKNTGAIERAIMSGATLTEIVSLKHNHYGNNHKMWAEQRNCFLRNKEHLSS